MNDDQLLRYSRHILLPEIGIEGQERLLGSHALVIGAGGLGSPIALYLASAGVGRITICDGDTVDLTNLQRQIVHRTESIGRPKVESARATLRSINPGSRSRRAGRARRRRSARRARGAAPTSCSTAATTSRRATRSTARACEQRKPLVSGAAVRFDGQVAVFDMRRDDAPCYACLFPGSRRERGHALRDHGRLRADHRHRRHDTGGRSAEAARSDTGERLTGRLLLVDALTMQLRTIRLQEGSRRARCAARRARR